MLTSATERGWGTNKGDCLAQPDKSGENPKRLARVDLVWREDTVERERQRKTKKGRRSRFSQPGQGRRGQSGQGEDSSWSDASVAGRLWLRRWH